MVHLPRKLSTNSPPRSELPPLVTSPSPTAPAWCQACCNHSWPHPPSLVVAASLPRHPCQLGNWPRLCRETTSQPKASLNWRSCLVKVLSLSQIPEDIAGLGWPRVTSEFGSYPLLRWGRHGWGEQVGRAELARTATRINCYKGRWTRAYPTALYIDFLGLGGRKPH